MNSRVLLKIAKTHLLARRKQTAVAALGVTFGIGTFIILISFMTGLNNLLDGLILNRTPHVRIYNDFKPTEKQPAMLAQDSAMHVIHNVKPKFSQASIHNNLALTRVLRRDARVKGVTPLVTARVFYTSGAIQLNGTLTGIDVLDQSRLFDFQNYMVGGKPENLANSTNGIVLGAGVAKKLSVDIGDYIRIISTTGSAFNLKVVAFYQSGLSDIDNVQSYVNLKTAQQVQGEGNSYVTDLYVKLTDIELSGPMAAEIRRVHGLNAVDIKTANAQFETGTSVRNMITFAVSITLMVVAGFGIYNILNMLIFQKMNDIAILKATGVSGLDVHLIFLYQAMMIGAMGGVLGLIMGFSVSWLISISPFETEALPTIKTFPVNFQPVFYLIGSGFALITTFFAGYMPARKASKIDPVDIIRGQ